MTTKSLIRQKKEEKSTEKAKKYKNDRREVFLLKKNYYIRYIVTQLAINIL